MKKFILLSSIALLGNLFFPPLLAQESQEDLKKEIQALKKGQEDIKRQLLQIQRLLQTQRAPARPAAPNVKDVVYDLGGHNPAKGESTAPLTLVEFTDYQ